MAQLAFTTYHNVNHSSSPTLKPVPPRPSDGIILPILCAIPIGIVASLFTTVFRLVIDKLEFHLFGSHADITDIMHRLPWYGCLLVPAVGGLIAALFLGWARRYEKEAGHQDYMAFVAEGKGHISWHATLLRSLSSMASIVSGGAIGREGAMVQLASLSGSLFGRLAQSPRMLRYFTACGASAGLASVYHAPLASAMFIAEIVMGDISVRKLVPLFAAAASASLTIKAMGLYDTPFQLAQQVAVFNTSNWLLILPMAVISGVFAPAFLALLKNSKTAFQRLQLPLAGQMALGGGLMGAIAIAIPEVAGNGYAPIIDLLSGQTMSAPVLLILLAKVAATTLVVGSGAVGGIFTPSLFIGAAFGNLMASLALQHGWIAHPATIPLTTVGMGAFMAAVSHAPLMAILMVFEMSMNASLLLPLMVGCVVSYSISSTMKRHSIYDVLNRRQRQQSELQSLSAITMRELLVPEFNNLDLGSTMAQAHKLFETTHTRYLYVLDTQGRFVGAVSMHRLSTHLYSHPQDSDALVHNLIEQDFIHLDANASLTQAWDIFMQTPLERLPIVENNTHPVLLGVVTKRDILSRAKRLQDLAR